ncbi:MAG: hypothetical protein QXF69_07785, partial [Thermofilaceae archaeon]
MPKVQAVHDKLMGGRYKPTPRILYTFIDSKPKSSKKYALAALGLIGLAVALGAYYSSVLLPQQKKAQRIEQLKKIGLTEEQALYFDNIFSKYANEDWLSSTYNKTITDFAIFYGKNQKLAEKTFNMLRNFKISNSFLASAIDKPHAISFLEKYSSLIKTSNFEYPLELYSKNSTIFEELYRNISLDQQITMNRNELISLTSKLFLDLGYTGKVKVYNSTSQAYEEKFVSIPLIWFTVNYSLAINQLNLPIHNKKDIHLTGNCVMLNPEIIDFDPIVFKSVDGNHIYLIPNPARESWLTCEILKRIKESGFSVEKYPEMFLGLNGKIVANAWCIFNESPYFSIAGREKEINKRVIKVTDEDVLNLMMLQWDLYSQFSP